jgi:hypothetical protein
MREGFEKLLNLRPRTARLHRVDIHSEGLPHFM